MSPLALSSGAGAGRLLAVHEVSHAGQHQQGAEAGAVVEQRQQHHGESTDEEHADGALSVSDAAEDVIGVIASGMCCG